MHSIRQPATLSTVEGDKGIIENTFREFIDSRTLEFYVIEINLFLVDKNVLIVMVLISINTLYSELRYVRLKLKVKNRHYFHTNLISKNYFHFIMNFYRL